MNYSNEDINAKVIQMLANGIKKYWDNQEAKEQMRIDQEKNGRELRKETEKNQKWYSQRRQEDPILILAERLGSLKEQADNKGKIDELYKLILDTQNEKAVEEAKENSNTINVVEPKKIKNLCINDINFMNYLGQ